MYLVDILSISPVSEQRNPLNRERVVDAGVGIADRGGVGELTMRRLADELDVTPMSLYNHITDKDDLIAGMVDAVFSEMDLPVVGGDWRGEIRGRATSMRQTLVRHPWAIGLLDAGTNPGPALLQHQEAVIGTLRVGGFSLQVVALAIALIDAYVYGFAIQETALQFEPRDDLVEIPEPAIAEIMRGQLPYMAELVAEHVLQPGYDFGAQFEVGLDLLLDGIEALREEAAATTPGPAPRRRGPRSSVR